MGEDGFMKVRKTLDSKPFRLPLPVGKPCEALRQYDMFSKQIDDYLGECIYSLSLARYRYVDANSSHRLVL